MSNIFLLYGEEKYDLYRKVEEIKNKFDKLELGINFFNITNDNLNELQSYIISCNFFRWQ